MPDGEPELARLGHAEEDALELEAVGVADLVERGRDEAVVADPHGSDDDVARTMPPMTARHREAA